MCPRPDRTWSHHSFNASTQASLVSRAPKTSIKAPVATIRMPNGTNFSFAGGSWSQPFGTLPSASVRVFPPTDVLTQSHLGLGVHGDLQSPGIVPDLFPHLLDVREDRVGLLGLLQRLALLDPLEARVHPIEDIAHRPFAGQLFLGIALRDQGLEHLGRRQVGGPPRRLQFRISVGMRCDEGADVGRQLRVLRFAALPTSRGEVFQAAHAVLLFVPSRLDRLASPTEASLGLAGTAAAQRRGHLGLEQAALISREATGPRPDQGVVLLNGVVHHGGPARGETVTNQPRSTPHSGRQDSSVWGRFPSSGRLSRNSLTESKLRPMSGDYAQDAIGYRLAANTWAIPDSL